MRHAGYGICSSPSSPEVTAGPLGQIWLKRHLRRIFDRPASYPEHGIDPSEIDGENRDNLEEIPELDLAEIGAQFEAEKGLKDRACGTR